jgi:retron-type reverse transcriptase
VWFVEGDIADCFGSLNHDVMVRILAEKIHDNRFLRLIANMLKAGYLEDWRYHETLSGCPQGGVVSPILSTSTAQVGCLRRDSPNPEIHQREAPESEP